MCTAIGALQADREALLGVCAELGDSEWKADSGCPAWSVQDVVAHMGTLFWMLVDSSTLPEQRATAQPSRPMRSTSRPGGPGAGSRWWGLPDCQQ